MVLCEPKHVGVAFISLTISIIYGNGGIEAGISQSTSVSPVSTIPPMFHTLSLLHVALTIRTNGQELRNVISNALS